MKIKEYYKSEECKYIIDNKPLEEYSNQELEKILDVILKEEYLHSYMERFIWSFELVQVGDTYFCDTCGTACSEFVVTLDGFSMKYSTHCYGDEIKWSCSDEEMMKIFRNKIENVELFKEFVGIGCDEFGGYDENLGCEYIYEEDGYFE